MTFEGGMARRSTAIKAVISAVLLCTVSLLTFAGRSIMSISIPVQNAEAIVLVAGAYEERSPLAVSLFKTGNAKSLVIVNDGVRRGWSREHQRNLYTTERAEIDLLQQGIPRPSIVILPFLTSGTVHDAAAVRDYIAKNNIRSILLVTSDYHSRRTLWIFQKVLRQLPVSIGIEPARSSFSSFPEIVLEYLKWVYYLIRFGGVDSEPFKGG